MVLIIFCFAAISFVYVYREGYFEPDEPDNSYCGDGGCDYDENCENCPEDCGPCPSVCGNGECEPGETYQNCPADCKKEPDENPEPTGAVCGDGKCEEGETHTNCPQDCTSSLPNEKPHAVFVGPAIGFVGDKYYFDASHSYDEDGEIEYYYWDWGGTGLTRSTKEKVTTHVWNSPGKYDIRLRVEDDDFASDVTMKSITIREKDPIAATIIGIDSPNYYHSGINFTIKPTVSWTFVTDKIPIYESDQYGDKDFRVLVTIFQATGEPKTVYSKELVKTHHIGYTKGKGEDAYRPYFEWSPVFDVTVTGSEVLHCKVSLFRSMGTTTPKDTITFAIYPDY